MGVVSYVGECCCCCCCCYLEVSAPHCRLIADLHHTKQQRGRLEAIFERGYTTCISVLGIEFGL